VNIEHSNTNILNKTEKNNDFDFPNIFGNELENDSFATQMTIEPKPFPFVEEPLENDADVVMEANEAEVTAENDFDFSDLFEDTMQPSSLFNLEEDVMVDEINSFSVDPLAKPSQAEARLMTWISQLEDKPSFYQNRNSFFGGKSKSFKDFLSQELEQTKVNTDLKNSSTYKN